MAWQQLIRIFLVLGIAFGVASGFQNCSGLDQPTGSGTSTAASIIDPGDITLLSVPFDVTLFVGANLNLEVQAESKKNHAISFKWFKNGVEQVGRTTGMMSVVSVTAGDGGRYTVVVSNAADSETIDVNVTISPIPVLTITTHPQPATLVEGTAGQLSVVASVTPSQTLAYQWYKDTVAVAGATSATLAIAANGIARSGNYHVRVQTTVGPLQTATSNTVKITHQQTFALGANGCVNGYCACVTPGQGFVPHRPSALAICVFKGFADLTTFATANGFRGVPHCSADGSGCFINAYDGNLTCSSVTCIK